MATPSTQKADQRPISFLLSNGITGALTSVNLVIRPEDLSRPAPSRISAIQTFGGAWVDNFGPGLASIQISGHTGWRGGVFADGAALFDQLKATVFDQWHAQRAAAVAAGQDPSPIQLIFADALDGFTNVVVPLVFELKRSRTRPLLRMYRLNMTVVAEQIDLATVTSIATDPGDLAAAGVASLADSLCTINRLATQVSTFIDANIVAPVASLLGLANTAFSAVLGAVGTGVQALAQVPATLLAIGLDVALVGRNAALNILSLAGAAIDAAFAVAQLAAAFENAFCVMTNAFLELLQFPDYRDLYGASVCSSTSGGSPLSPLRGQNAWELIVPAPASPVSVTADAQSSIALFRNMDPVLLPIPLTQMARQLSLIGSGVTFQ